MRMEGMHQSVRGRHLKCVNTSVGMLIGGPLVAVVHPWKRKEEIICWKDLINVIVITHLNNQRNQKLNIKDSSSGSATTTSTSSSPERLPLVF